MKRFDSAMDGWLKATVVDPAWVVTLIASGLIALLGDEGTLRLVRVDAGIAMVGMSGALLGTVLAGLAIFAAFLNKKYVALIDGVYGIASELWPFKWTALMGTMCVALGMGLIVLGDPPTLVFRLFWMLALWVFFYLLWQIYELVKYLVEHAKTRAAQIQQELDHDDKI